MTPLRPVLTVRRAAPPLSRAAAVLAALLAAACAGGRGAEVAPTAPTAAHAAPTAPAVPPAVPALPPAHPPVAGGPEGVAVDAAEAQVRVTVVAEDTVRVRLSRTPGAPAAESYAVDPAALARPAPPYTVEDTGAAVVIRTAALTLRVTRAPLRLALLDAGGAVVAEEAAPVAWRAPGARLAWTLPDGEHVFGLGDKARGFDRRGQTFTLWNFDAYGWGEDTDPLYKSIPFLVFLRNGRAHGLFVDDPGRAQVDVGASAPDRLAWELERGDAVDLYLFAGPEPKRVIAAYAALTGRTPLPPAWALGYHQSRYSYETEAEVRDLAATFRAHRIPLDAIWLDIDYQEDRAPFTVDAKRFPTFERMIADLGAGGIQTVVITDPHLKAARGSPPYDAALRGDHLVRAPSGKVFEGEVWPGRSVFPEFTRARTRAFWGDLYAGFVRAGVAGFWNDMNEPALFGISSKTMPEGTPHRRDDGSVVDHVSVHNAYGALNARATYEGILRLRPGVRPFVLTRAAYAGAQRYAASWTGDNVATEDHLALTLPTLLDLGVSGYPFVGADVGGFVGCPSAELLTRWMELGAFQPFFRNHSAKGTCRREPWVHGAAHEARRRAAIEGRYRILPYLYTAFEQSSRDGLPVMRPLWLEYPSDPAVATEDRAFLLGRDLLVMPRLRGAAITLPGAGWWDTRTGEKLAGGIRFAAPARGASVAVLARAGAIVPEAPVVEHADAIPDGPLTVEVWPGPDCAGTLYLDDGKSFAYRDGDLRRVAFRCAEGPDGIEVSASSAGAHAVWWRSTEVVVHGLPHPPRAVSVEGGAGATVTRYDAAARAATVVVPGDASAWRVALRW